MVERLVDRPARPSRRRRCRRRRTGRSTFPARCRARPSKSKTGPAIPTGARFFSVETAERGAHRADLPAFRRLRRLRRAALAERAYRAWKRDLVVDGAAPGRHRRAGRRTHRRPRRRPPPRRVSRAPRHPRRAGSRLFRGARASPRRDRPLSGPGQKPRRRARRPHGRSPKCSAPTKKPLDIQVTATDAGLDVDVRGSGPADGGC